MRRSTMILSAVLGLAALFAAPEVRSEDREIRIGTLAPRRSLWGKVFQAWQEAVLERSGGTLKLTFFWNGNQGDDLAMVDKVRAGSQIDGAAMSALVLGKSSRNAPARKTTKRSGIS